MLITKCWRFASGSGTTDSTRTRVVGHSDPGSFMSVMVLITCSCASGCRATSQSAAQRSELGCLSLINFCLQSRMA